MGSVIGNPVTQQEQSRPSKTNRKKQEDTGFVRAHSAHKAEALRS